MADLQISPFYSGRGFYDITAPDGSKYIYVPKEFAEKGFVQDGYQWFEPAFLSPDAFSKASEFTLPTDSVLTAAAKSLYSNPTQGYIWKAEDFAPLNTDDFSVTGYQISAERPAILGYTTSYYGSPAYEVGPQAGYEGWQRHFLTGYNAGAGEGGSDVMNWSHYNAPSSGGGGFFGSFLSDIGQMIIDLGPIAPLALNAIMPGLGTAVAIGSQLGQGNVEGALASAIVGNALNDVLPSTGTAAGDAALKSATAAVITGQDPLQAGLSAGLGNYVGQEVGTATDSPLAAATASGAARTALAGGDPIEGALYNALSYGANSLRTGSGGTESPSDYQLSGDYSFNPDYSLSSGAPTDEDWTGGGLKTNPINDTSYLDTGIADYSLGTTSQPSVDLQMPKTPNLDEMGGGQGFVYPVPGGYITSQGFIPYDYMPPLGDPDSFINKPAPGEDVGDAVQQALDAKGYPVGRAFTGSGKDLNAYNQGVQQWLQSQKGSSGASDFLPKFIEVKDPWLKTTIPAGQTAQMGLQPLQQLYNPTEPETDMNPMFADGGSVFDEIDPDLLDILTTRMPYYASGGDVNPFTNMLEVAKGLSPNLVKQTPQFLKPQGQTKPLQLQALKQLSQTEKFGRGMAKGGLPSKYEEAAPEGHHPEFITGLTGYYAGGRGTGQSDDIPAMLHDGDYVMDAEAVSALGDGSSKAGKDVLTHFMRQVPHEDRQEGNPVPAKIADGEFVLPSAFVTALGGGDNKHGSKLLDEMREKLREHKRSAPLSKIPPKAKAPLDYLEGVKG